jgi:hypothetical protein
MARRGDFIRCTFLSAAFSCTLGAQSTGDSLRIYYVGRPVGWEHYEIAKTDGGLQLNADWSYVDRGRRIHTQAVMKLATDYAPASLKVDRLTDSTRTPALDVTVSGRSATIVRGAATTTLDLPPVAFAISQYTPVSQHLALIRYWKAHGSPASLAVFPGDPVNPVKIRAQGTDNLTVGGRRVTLTRYSIDGVVWGIEYAWLDPDGRPVHHLIDPSTGAPGGAGLAAVTVAFPDPAWAEVWSKALFLEGASGIADAARRRGLAAWWVDEAGELSMTPAARQQTGWVRAEARRSA